MKSGDWEREPWVREVTGWSRAILVGFIVSLLFFFVSIPIFIFGIIRRTALEYSREEFESKVDDEADTAFRRRRTIGSPGRIASGMRRKASGD